MMKCKGCQKKDREIAELKEQNEQLERISQGTCTSRDLAQQESDTLRSVVKDIFGMMLDELKGRE